MARSFPFINPVTINPEQERPKPPLAVEWAWDFKKMTYAKKGGKQYKVYEDEAIKVWFWKLFMTERYFYPIHTFDYGNELYRLYREPYTPNYTNALAESRVREAASYAFGPKARHTYVTALNQVYIEGYRIPFIQFSEGTLYVRCSMDTIYNKGVNIDFASIID